MFQSGALGFIKIPYSAGEQEGYFFHPVVQLVMKDRPTRTFSFYLDASPLSLEHTHAKVVIEHQVRDNFPVVVNILDTKSKQVLLSPTVLYHPFAVTEFFYLFSAFFASLWFHFRSILTVVPTPSWLSTSISPSCCSTIIRWTIAMPKVMSMTFRVSG